MRPRPRHLKASAANRLRGSVVEDPLRKMVAAVERGTARTNRDEHRRLSLLFAWLLRSDDSCIDIGANRGSVLEEFVRLAPEGAHLAFEPIPELARDLRTRFPRVDVRESALSSHPGESTFTWFPEMPGFSRLGSSPPVEGFHGREITVQKERLDDVLPDGLRPRIIKVDAEGEDRAVLEGAMTVIREHRPLVIFEHTGAGQADDEDETDQLVELLCGAAGMRIFDLHGGGPYDVAMLREAYVRQRHFNFVAHS